MEQTKLKQSPFTVRSACASKLSFNSHYQLKTQAGRCKPARFFVPKPRGDRLTAGGIVTLQGPLTAERLSERFHTSSFLS